MIEFVRKSPARVYAVAAAVLALVAHFVPDWPVELSLAVAAAILGVGEGVQRVENRKTATARALPPVGGCENCPLN